MSSEKTDESVFLMAPQVESVGKVGMALLRKTHEENFEALTPGQRGAVEEDVTYFFDEVSDLLLNWISAGRIDDIDRLQSVIQETIFAESDEPHFLDDARLNRRITARLDALSQVMRVLLRRDSPAKYLGQISGQRRGAWRDLLVALYDHGLAVRKRKAFELTPSIKDEGTAYYTLEKLANMGLIDRYREGSAKFYQLSWPGRTVARTLRDLHPDDLSDAPRLKEWIEDLEVLWTQPKEPPPVSEEKWAESSAAEFDPDLVVVARA